MRRHREVRGIVFVLLSAALSSCRSVMEEILLGAERELAGVTFASASCACSAVTAAAVLFAAQMIPGPDHGVQAR